MTATTAKRSSLPTTGLRLNSAAVDEDQHSRPPAAPSGSRRPSGWPPGCRDPAERGGSASMQRSPAFTKSEGCHGLAGLATRLLLPISREPKQKLLAQSPVGDEAEAARARRGRLLLSGSNHAPCPSRPSDHCPFASGAAAPRIGVSPSLRAGPATPNLAADGCFDDALRRSGACSRSPASAAEQAPRARRPLLLRLLERECRRPGIRAEARRLAVRRGGAVVGRARRDRWLSSAAGASSTVIGSGACRSGCGSALVRCQRAPRPLPHSGGPTVPARASTC